MAIKCTYHSSQDATSLCKQCGFLCDQDIEDENLFGHSRISITPLHSLVAAKLSQQKLLQLLHTMKKQSNALIDKQISIIKTNLATINSRINKQTEFDGNSDKTLINHMLQSNTPYQKNSLQKEIYLLSKLKSGVNTEIDKTIASRVSILNSPIQIRNFEEADVLTDRQCNDINQFKY